MIDILLRLHQNSYYFFAILLFIIGFHTMLTHNNLIKKIMGMNIMETSIFLFFVSIGYVRGGRAPILVPGAANTSTYINPLPTALILTGIVVAVSVTAYSLSLIVKIYQHYGTIDAEEIMRLRGGD